MAFWNRRRKSAATIPDGTFRFIALDVETANSDVGSICQIGIACVDQHGGISTFGTLVDPQDRFDDFNIDIHGIAARDVRGAPLFYNAIQSLMPLLGRHQLFQHSSFDKNAVNRACEDCGLSQPDLNWHDSVVVARRAWPHFKGNGGHGLANLKTELGLVFDHHDAVEDARASAMVVLYAEAATGKNFEELAKPRAKKFYSKPAVKTGNPDGALAGQIAVFTGALTMTRTEAADLAAEHGIDVKSGVTKQTTLLVVGDQDMSSLAGHSKSSKHRKAEALLADGQDIRILSQTEFLAIIAGADGG